MTPPIYSKCGYPPGLSKSITNFTKDATKQRLFGKNIDSDHHEKWYLTAIERERRIIWLLIWGTYELAYVGPFARKHPDIFTVMFQLETALEHVPTLRPFTIRKISIDAGASGWNETLWRFEQQAKQIHDIRNMRESLISGSIALHRRAEMLLNKLRRRYNSTISKRRQFQVEQLGDLNLTDSDNNLEGF